MSLRAFCLLAATISWSLTAPGVAQEGGAGAKQEKEPGAKDAGRSADSAWETGKVTIGSDLAVVDLPDGYRFLRGEKAQKALEQMGNPPDPGVLGLIAPEGDSPWFVVVQFDDAGHVDDEDARHLDYDELLTQMQEDTREGSKERVRRGYEAVELLGWAERPHYDAAAKKLYFAKRLRFGSGSDETLNYSVRILGRRGYLLYNAVSGVEDLQAVAAGSKVLLERTEFSAGNRYADFDPSIDAVAAYGIGGLIAGKVLMKAGFFKMLLAFIKPILIGLAVVGGVVWKVLSGRRRERTVVAADGPGPD